MVLADERILEYIRENESGAPTEMAESGNVRYTPQHISQRCKKLAENDLLQPLGNGVYLITDAGESYLDEEYDAGRGKYLNQDMANGDECNGAADAEGTNGG
jgi:predicted transcriptional regulator